MNSWQKKIFPFTSFLPEFGVFFPSLLTSIIFFLDFIKKVNEAGIILKKEICNIFGIRKELIS